MLLSTKNYGSIPKNLGSLSESEGRSVSRRSTRDLQAVGLTNGLVRDIPAELGVMNFAALMRDSLSQNCDNSDRDKRFELSKNNRGEASGLNEMKANVSIYGTS